VNSVNLPKERLAGSACDRNDVNGYTAFSEFDSRKGWTEADRCLSGETYNKAGAMKVPALF